MVTLGKPIFVTILNGKYSPQSIQGSFDALLCPRNDENPSADKYSSILPHNKSNK